MEYAWIIDQDLICVGEDIGSKGPSQASNTLLGRLQSGEGIEFRILDSDDTLYYSGRILGDYEGFEPLDDFGCPNAGATDIQYKNQLGKWETL